MSLSGSLSSMAEATVIPLIFKYIETKEPALETALVGEITKLKTSNPSEFNIFLNNWRKINSAIERSIVPVPPPTGGVIPTEIVSSEPIVPSHTSEEKAGTRKRTYRRKRTHTVKHRNH